MPRSSVDLPQALAPTITVTCRSGTAQVELGDDRRGRRSRGVTASAASRDAGRGRRAVASVRAVMPPSFRYGRGRAARAGTAPRARR